MMEFPDSYFEAEVREGFYVPSIMKRAWAAELEVIDKIQKVCKKHNIQYYAEWGTLLGAIRHGGMIPWDDDFDICMKSEEYKRFLEVADELPESYVITDYLSYESSDNMVISIHNSEKLIVSGEFLENYHGCPYTAGTDIFCLDYLPEDKEREKEFRRMIQDVGGVIGEISEVSEEELENIEEITEFVQNMERICGMKLEKEASLKKRLYYLIVEALPSIYCAGKGKELTHLPLWSGSGNRNYRFPNDCFEDSVAVPFETTEIMVPVGYEELLRKKYGENYMKPVRSGGSHDYPYFNQLKESLQSSTLSMVMEYRFSMDEMKELENLREEERTKRGESLQEKVRDFLPLFREAHENLLALIKEEDWNTAVSLLGDCQDVAIQIGTLIEGEMGEGHKTVALLEQYCESVFQIHGELVSAVEEGRLPDVQCGLQNLVAFEDQFAQSVEQDLKRKKEIVFIPYKVSYWNAMDSAWRTAMEEADTQVYVIPAPYYYKDNFGNMKKEEQHFEMEGYPEDVVITSYEKYNFQVHHPDVIVIQCPYDEYDYGISLHPFFYAQNLKQYTEELVYIPPLVMDEIGPEDERAKETLKLFCNMPGVVHADKVIVQSEQMKKVYVELLTEFAGEDTKEIWESKIQGLGSPVYDYEKRMKKETADVANVPQEWLDVVQKPDGSCKKVILYSTSASALLYRGEKMIDKMKKVFLTFRENQDEVALLWRPDLKAREMLRRKHSVLWQKYRDLVQEYRERGWGIYDDSQDCDRAVELCDAAYGDGGSVMNRCRALGKPVMIQNSDI
jgi:phosphorylcholine metabolism protein LicD